MIVVQDISGNPILDLDVRIAVGEQTIDKVFAAVEDGGAYDDKRTDDAGHLAWPNPLPSSEGYTLWFNYANVKPGWGTAFVHVPELETTVVLERSPLTRLHVAFPWFANAQWQRTFIKGHTDFLLHKHLLDGNRAKVEELLKQRADFGSNCARIIGMSRKYPNGAGIADYRPQVYGEAYYDYLPETFELLDRYGMYGYYCAFADTGIVMPDYSEQRRHWDRLLSKFEPIPNVLVEHVNERYSKDNDVDHWESFPMPNFLPVCSGSYNDSYQGGGVPVPSRGNFADFHTPRDGHKPDGFKYCADQNMAAHPNFRQLRMPVLSGEPQKFGDVSLGPIYAGNNLLSNPTQARMVAGSARGTSLGIIYHTVHGVYSELWDGIEQSCAREWFDELR